VFLNEKSGDPIFCEISPERSFSPATPGYGIFMQSLTMLRCRTSWPGKTDESSDSMDVAFMGLDCVGNSHRGRDVHQAKRRQSPRSRIATAAVDRHSFFGERMLLDSGHRACEYLGWGTLATTAKSRGFGAGSLDPVDGCHYPGEIVQCECSNTRIANSAKDRTLPFCAASFLPGHAADIPCDRIAFAQLGEPGRGADSHDLGVMLSNSHRRSCVARCVRGGIFGVQQGHEAFAPRYLLIAVPHCG
jgi:hypothetical protein